MAPTTASDSTAATSAAEAEQKRNIIIIGGGIIGTTTAYYLTRHPSYNPALHSITLLEATTIAGGASGKAGGLLALWAYPSSLVPLSYRLHKELADEHGGEERWGYRAVHCAQVECVGRKIDTSNESKRRRVDGKNGVMDGDNTIPGLADGETDGTNDNGQTEAGRVSLLKRSQDALKKLRAAGVPPDLDWLDPEALKAYEQMGDPSTTAQVHPFQFTTAMAQLAREKGVEIRERAVVTKINYTADGKGVESVTYEDRRGEGKTSSNGVVINGDSSKTNGTKEEHTTPSPPSSTSTSTTTLPATDIIVTAGPWTRSVLPSAPIAGLRAHSVTIRPSRPVSAYALFTQIKLPSGFPSSSSSSSTSPSGPRIPWGRPQFASPEIYARPRNEVYACGEGDRLVPLPAFSDEVAVDESRCQDIVDQVASVSAELRDGEVTARQACYLPNVTGGGGSGDPLVGLTKTKGLFVAAGHTCWGIQNGPGTGKLMSEFVFDGRATSSKVANLDPRRCL